jgi:hypothetical protein
MMSQRIVKLPLFLFGSFTFGWTLGTVFHELGHAISMWITGGTVSRITINPFSWSYTYYGTSPRFPAFTTWSGVVLGSVLGLLLLFIVTRKHSPYFFPFVLASVAPILNGGGYYLVDILVSHRGDASSLLQSGTPKFVLLGAAVFWLILGLYLVIRLINLSGVKPEDPFINRMVIFGFGILPYFQLSALYSMIYTPEDTLQEIVSIVLVVILVLVLAFASIKMHQRQKATLVATVEWKHVAYALVLGFAAIVIPFLIFGYP